MKLFCCMKKKKENIDDFSGLKGSPELQKEMTGASDRAAAIIGATALDVYLGRLLEVFLIDSTSEVKNLIDSSNINSPLGGFSSRIRACFCLGLISENEFNSLKAIRDIRNIFAHQLSACTFEEAYIKEQSTNNFIVRKMKGIEKMTSRMKFTILVYGIETILEMRIAEAGKQRRLIPRNLKFAL